jgi:hypothetical protein
MLQGEATDRAGLSLQSLDRQAVVEAVLQRISGGGGTEVAAQAEIQLKPLACLPLALEHPHMGPEAQAPHQHTIRR